MFKMLQRQIGDQTELLFLTGLEDKTHKNN